MVILVAKNTTGSQWAQFFLKALTEIEGLAAIASATISANSTNWKNSPTRKPQQTA